MYQEKHTHTQNPTNIHRNQNQKMKPKKERMGERKERKKGGRKEGREREGKRRKPKNGQLESSGRQPSRLCCSQSFQSTGDELLLDDSDFHPHLNAPIPPLHPQLHY